MTLQELYTEIGGDYNEVRGRLPSDKFIQKFVLKFLDDKSYDLLISSLEQGNSEEAFRAAHTLKGVGMNLGITRLYQISGELTEEMRGGKKPENMDLIAKLEAEYEHTRAVISEFAGA